MRITADSFKNQHLFQPTQLARIWIEVALSGEFRNFNKGEDFWNLFSVGRLCSLCFDHLNCCFALYHTILNFLGSLGRLRSTRIVEAVLTLTKARNAVHASLMTDAVVLLAIILPTVASLPFEWFLKHFLLSFTCFNCLLWIIILAVLALTDVLIAGLSVSKADAVHLLALSFRTSALLSWFSLSVDPILSYLSWSARRGRLMWGLENLSHLLVHVYQRLPNLHGDHIGFLRAWSLRVIRGVHDWWASDKGQSL